MTYDLPWGNVVDEQSQQGQADQRLSNSQPMALVHDVPMLNCEENRVDLSFSVLFSPELQTDFSIRVLILDLQTSKQREELDLLLCLQSNNSHATLWLLTMVYSKRSVCWQFIIQQYPASPWWRHLLTLKPGGLEPSTSLQKAGRDHQSADQ